MKLNIWKQFPAPAAVVAVLLLVLAGRGSWMAARFYLNQGLIDSFALDREQSLPLLAQAYTWQPDDERIVWQLGRLHHLAQQPEAAVSVWQTSPLAGVTLLQHGDAFLAEADWEAALLWYTYAQQVDAASARAINGQGDAWWGLADWVQARAAYAQALELEANEAEYYLDYARVLMLDEADLDLAAEMLEKAAVLTPDSEAVYRSLANLAARRGDMEQTVYWWEQAGAVPGPSIDTLLHLAEVYEQTNRLAEAVSIYEQAAAQAPDAPSTRLGLAAAYLALGEPQSALAETEVVLSRFPQNVMAWFIQGEAWLALGNEGEAHRALTQVLAIEPEHPQALALLQTLPSE
ncbi:MAG: tetratricopeptide repeat protein [Ardenticatenaceae bacterium]|nr:tetratricopeptide repeat protein [Ardenticatenaceae bacterium]